MDTLKYASIALTLALVAACTAPPPSRPDVDTTALVSRAEQQAEAGNLAAAVATYLELAGASRGAERAEYLIEAARLEIEAGRLGDALTHIGEARNAGTSEQRDLATALAARVDLEQGRPQAALDRLEGLSASQGELDLLRELTAVRGRALFAVGRTVEAVRVLTEREIWLERADAILANQRLIWEGLQGLPPDAQPEPTGDPLVDGWLALAPLARTDPESDAFRVELLQWRSAYADHPAAGGLLADLVSRQRGDQMQPRHFALLLPLSSPQRQAALAIRDGFIAGHFDAGGEAAISVYDTAALGAAEAYQQAQLEGADFIVGPLLERNVGQVMGQSGFVPTLALNFSQRETPFMSSFYQFALSPEDEARAVARRAAAEGARTAIALVESDPRDDWGYRLLNAFRQEFEAFGGEVLEYAGYDPAVSDFTGQITEVLNIDASQARHRRLAANIGREVLFEPRRRQDVDMIFLATDAPTGRLLIPQLRFHGAGDIPTYATREIYDPARTERDSDLNGVRFPDAPLLVEPDSEGAALKRTIERFWPENGMRWIRFYGLGYDAHRLAAALYRPAGVAWPIAGVSGQLRLGETGRIHRDLPFAQFQNGVPVALQAPPSGRPGSAPALSRR